MVSDCFTTTFFHLVWDLPRGFLFAFILSVTRCFSICPPYVTKTALSGCFWCTIGCRVSRSIFQVNNTSSLVCSRFHIIDWTNGFTKHFYFCCAEFEWLPFVVHTVHTSIRHNRSTIIRLWKCYSILTIIASTWILKL